MDTRLRITQIGDFVPDAYTLSQAIEATRSFLRRRKWEMQVIEDGEADESSDSSVESSSSSDTSDGLERERKKWRKSQKKKHRN